MNRTQSTLAIIGAIVVVGGLIFAQNVPPKELDALTSANIFIDCTERTINAMDNGTIGPEDRHAYKNACIHRETKDASKRFWQ